MPKNNDNTLEKRINNIKNLTKKFPEEKDILDLRLFHFLDIFSHRKENELDIFPSLIECIKEKAEGKEILLYLFLNNLEEEVKTSLLEITRNESKEEIEQQINNFSSSELPEPSLYKGWGFRFSEAGISEKDNKLHIKIDDIFEGSKLTDRGVEKGNTIIIENPATFKTDGKFDIGKIAQHIRMQKLLTAKTSDGGEVEIEEDEKTYFYQDKKNSKFMAFSIKEGISIEEAKNQEAAILAAHERVKQQLQSITPTQDTTTPTQDTTTPTNEPAKPTQGAFNNSTEKSL